ncbi:MAG: adenine-specific methyltransferase EcoRI family protein [Bacteroidales bacterium]
MKGNSNLQKARKEKNNEFYTSFKDVNDEVDRHRSHFKDQIVYLNCDGLKSEFYRYFKNKFKSLGLKKLIATHYDTKSKTYKLEYDGKEEIKTTLNSNGDFRSLESMECLVECDIVVTNPPFSLFREFISLLLEFDKKFLIMGNNNALSYVEIFQHIQNGRMWLGYNSNKTMEFKLSPDYEIWDRIDEEGNKYGKVPAISWFTNLPHKKRNEEIPLFRNYNKEDYPEYDNYSVIDVSKVKDIPQDYKGIMGVPITFLTKYNPDQFVILGITKSNSKEDPLVGLRKDYIKHDRPYLNGKRTYPRIMIKHKKDV